MPSSYCALRFGQCPRDPWRACFEHVKVVPFVDSLFVTETQPLMDYIHSMIGIWNVPDRVDFEIEKWITAEIAAKGGFYDSKSSGVVLAW